MTDRVTVKFKLGADKYVMEKGQWCKIYKQVFIWKKYMKRQVTYYSEGSMNSLSNYMECARLFIEEGTHHAAYISVSIIPFTRRDVKKVRYWLLIG